MSETKPLVDYDFGLSQLGGNAELLNKMLGKFKGEFREAPQYVKQQMQEGNFDQAKMKVHTTKGITGNLGLLALFECSKTLDAQLKQAIASDDTIAEFESITQATCERIDELISASKNDSGQSDTAKQHKHVDDAKQKLLELLERHEFIDDSLLRDLMGSLNMSDADKTQIVDLIEQLQYEQAASMLNSQ
ncbi:hypothetical protein ACFO4O_06635 [Glaciecola siphonariae]|uniref:HPt domain-containing protein n=1 Tax=Glaciecola siphonariae TaxID=521012 RepID=A0ABV9LTI9_9ALTE